MTALTIAKVTLPTDLAATTNGNLPAGMLTVVGPQGKLHHLAARAWLALQAAAIIARVPLTYTYGGTYRTFQQQIDLFVSRYAVGGGHGDPKAWRGQVWTKKLVDGKVPSTAATPGTSNHGWGLAIDTALDSDWSDGIGPDDATSITPSLEWLAVNAPRFGFSWETLPSEPWHIRYVAGDQLPAAVTAHEHPTATAPPAITPIAPQEDDMRVLTNAEPRDIHDGNGTYNPGVVYYRLTDNGVAERIAKIAELTARGGPGIAQKLSNTDLDALGAA